MIPLSTLSTAGIPSDASGLYNMMRNLGGSIGIALLSALLTVRERLHSNRLGEQVSPYNPLARERLSWLTEKFALAGSDAYTAGRQAVAALDAMVRREATLQAFNDCFHMLGLALFLAIAAVVFCRPVKGAGPSAAH
jgi:DHA2 family multidrug resistance protein